jgi:hypothetical protein
VCYLLSSFSDNSYGFFSYPTTKQKQPKKKGKTKQKQPKKNGKGNADGRASNKQGKQPPCSITRLKPKDRRAMLNSKEYSDDDCSEEEVSFESEVSLDSSVDDTMIEDDSSIEELNDNSKKRATVSKPPPSGEDPRKKRKVDDLIKSTAGATDGEDIANEEGDMEGEDELHLTRPNNKKSPWWRYFSELCESIYHLL